jgi:hypothetical protein
LKATRGIRGSDRIVVGFTTTYAISAYQHQRYEFASCSGKVYALQHYVIKEQIKKMEHSIVRSALAIYKHERLLSTITQIQIMENHFVLMSYISVTIGLLRMNITHALK